MNYFSVLLSHLIYAPCTEKSEGIKVCEIICVCESAQTEVNSRVVGIIGIVNEIQSLRKNQQKK